jgi:hypothetical protein
VSQFLQSSSPTDAGDVEIFFVTERYPVSVGPDLRSSGWRGGEFVEYVTGSTDFTVELSDGNQASGFLLFQSENYKLPRPYGEGPGSPQNYLPQQYRDPVGANNVVTMISGGTRAFFRVYETVAINPATGLRDGGAGDLVYSLNDTLRVSERGRLCNDSEANLATAGVLTPRQVGIVSAVPSSLNSNRLGADIRF